MQSFAISFLVLAAAVAPAGQQASPNPLGSLASCRAIGDSQARLACYDKAAADLQTAIATKELTLVTRSDARATRRSLFGFTLPKLPFFGNDDEPEAKQLTAKIAATRSLGYGKWEFKLSDGATWQTTEGTDFGETPQPGQNVTIKRGTLGNYFILFEGIQPVRGHRVS